MNSFNFALPARIVQKVPSISHRLYFSNEVNIIGYVGAPPQLKPFEILEGTRGNTQNQLGNLWSFSLATKLYRKKQVDGTWKEDVDWHRVKDFRLSDDLANTMKYQPEKIGAVKTGALVQVRGKLSYFTTADGRKFSQIVAKEVSVIQPSKKT
ncbi:hypothetical protein BDR26DRAFT_855386 [Obelidium mucronatum]|nr:hypothetical protein BDR26DRAFT_855386 [Obelidium mucronatum]